MARSGFTLPVFAVAATKAALLHLLRTCLPAKSIQATEDADRPGNVSLNLLPSQCEIPIEQVATLSERLALAIVRSDPGDNLDLTRNTPIWAYVRLVPRNQSSLVLEAGEGLGRSTDGTPAIYRFARQLFTVNIEPLIPPQLTAIVRIILPQGRQLARRTSNEAFGVLEGLALLGTSGISQPLAAADALEAFRQQLRERAATSTHLAFCLGSNGRRVAERLGITGDRLVQTANWVGAMLVEAGLLGVRSVLLIGYHGKLVKLAGGIFHTSSHLADGKLEILAAAAIRVGADADLVRSVLRAATAEEARRSLVQAGWAERVFGDVSERIEQKATDYVHKYSERHLDIGVILFDRAGEIVFQTETARNRLVAMT